MSIREVVTDELDFEIVVSAFELQSRYYVHFQTYTLGGRCEAPYPLQLGVK